MWLTDWRLGIRSRSGRPWGAVLLVAAVWLGGGWLLAGCGGSGPGNGSKCSQCGDTDGPCDNPKPADEKVCWDNVNKSCSEDGDCETSNRCVEFRECSGSGAICSTDDDCGGTEGGTCGTTKRCLGRGGLEKTCSSDEDCDDCVSEQLACLRKLGSAERICFDVSLKNTPELQCGTKFTLEGGGTTTTTTTTTTTVSTTTSSSTTTTTS